MIGDDETAAQRLNLFGVGDASILRRQFVTSGLVCGRKAEVLRFYDRLRRELSGKQHLLAEPGMMEGLFNRLAWSADPELSITVRPNGSVAYFPVVPSNMAIETRPVMRVGGAPLSILMTG